MGTNDLPIFAALNADPEVMAYYPRILTESESHVFAKHMEALLVKRGWGFWAVEHKSTKNFMGFVGLHQPEVELPFTPCVEIGWRVAKVYWGNGYATEAARGALAFAFQSLRVQEVVSYTSLLNTRSQAVMHRLGMIDTKKNFEHPNLPIGHHLREHVLYNVTKTQWDLAFK